MSILSKVITTVFGKKSDKDLKKLSPIIGQINDVYVTFENLSDEQLKNKFSAIKDEFKILEDGFKDSYKGDRFSNDYVADLSTLSQNFLDDKMIEVFAIVKDASRRLVGTKFNMMGQGSVWDMVHYDVQLIGGVVLHQGKIAEMKTGEGKTLVSTLAIALNALTGRGVHVVTVNDYLAERDSQWMGHLFQFLGLSVGCILNQMPPVQRREMYLKDITYGTNSQFGFDYLRDNMSMFNQDQVQRKHSYAIIDEVDSVLIDEARTPLIISGQVDSEDNPQYKQYNNMIKSLVRKQSSLSNALISEAEELLDSDEKEAGKKLLMAMRGAPKNKRLIKVLGEQGVKQLVYNVESEILRESGKLSKDNKMNQLDEQLYFTIDEKTGIIDISEKGRDYLSPNSPEDFIIPDIGELYHEVENDSSLNREQIYKKKEEIQTLHAERSGRIHAINQLLKAYSLYEKDIQYIVQDGKVLIVDEHTGRVLHGRKFSDGLHSALEAKENVVIEKESQTMATITIQNYFRMYDKLAGMTGTAVTEAGEFMQIYKLDVVEIPTYRPISRIDHEDIIFRTKREKYNATVEKATELFNSGQPVLVGTTSVEESEVLSRMLRKNKIPHNVLNAKQHQREAEIITMAGHQSAITIATNMAGRGTDIKLGSGVKDLGGLFILGTGRHESRRIDLQLRGRSGRQGDAGESIFYLSLEDDLMRLFGSDRIAKVMDRLGVEEGEVITHSMVTKSIERAQKKIESRNFSIRKHVLEYDDVMNQQREVIYDRRNYAMKGDDLLSEINEIANDYIEESIGMHCQSNIVEDWNWYDLETEIMDIFSLDISGCKNKITDSAKMTEYIKNGISEILQYKNDTSDSEMFESFQRYIISTTIDMNWRDHLYAMDQLREGIGLRAYGQKNPLIEYKKEGFGMFDEMISNIDRDILKRIFRTNIENISTTQVQTRVSPKNIKMKHEESPGMSFIPPQASANPSTGPIKQPRIQPAQADKKYGRNDKVKISNGMETKELKYKKAESLIAQGWSIIE
jgi:preprotein translocase subunit SecA